MASVMLRSMKPSKNRRIKSRAYRGLTWIAAIDDFEGLPLDSAPGHLSNSFRAIRIIVCVCISVVFISRYYKGDADYLGQ